MTDSTLHEDALETNEEEKEEDDDDDEACIIRLQLEDIADLLRCSKSKVDAAKSDANYALELYAQELQALQSSLADKRMGLSISRAVETDAGVILQARLEESRATRDHKLACSLDKSPRPQGPEHEDWASKSDDDDDELLLDTPAAALDAGPKAHSESLATSSKCKLGQEGGPDVTKRLQCISCTDEQFIFDTLVAPCNHRYCRRCVAELFTQATVDESLFPPRCCRQEIPVSEAEKLVEPATIRAFQKRSIEFSSKEERTYCSHAGCSAFIPRVNVEAAVGRCAECDARTCTMCKAAAHDGDCPQDAALMATLALAEEQGWQRCYCCGRLLELDTGCFHMTCPCGAEFCYVCGSRWRTCECPQWDEDRLVRRAGQIQARAAQQQQQPADEDEMGREVRRNRIADILRLDHDCTHEQWHFVRGSHVCEECHFTLPQFIFQCRNCRLQACGRCRRNRL